MRTRITKAIPWLALTSAASFLAAGLVVLLPAPAVGQTESSAVTQTRTMENEYSYTEPAGKYKASVTVSQTKDLVRQRVKVSWSGLRPTGSGGVGSETFPVVVLQCWGKPAEVTQQTCWNGGANVGTLLDSSFVDPGTFDPAVFGTASASSFVPFRAKDDGKMYVGEQRDGGWPPDTVVKSNPTSFSSATQNAVYPNLYHGFTNPDGTGEADMELLTGFENPHLGCGSASPCSLVVIPIGDPRCKPDSALPRRHRGFCATPPLDESGARRASNWVSPTNWARKFTFDLSFRESPEACKLDNRLETGFAGSFYAYQVLNNSWQPKFCHDQNLFKLGYIALSDGEARGQFAGALGGTWQDGATNALLTSRPMEGEPAKPFVYAPVTVSSVVVSFTLDGLDGKEITELKLNARLLAKMLTQSYRTTSAAGLGHPALKNNPTWWGSDPEFAALNPAVGNLGDLLRDGSEYPVFSLGDLDAIHALTAYIAADKDAMAWLTGADDGHGMVVNPKFKQYQLPLGKLELRDDWVVTDQASQYAGEILLDRYANTADNLYNAAVAATQAWPQAFVTRSCVDPTKPETCSFKRKDQRQLGGHRAMVAVTTFGDSKVFNLRQAALQTAPGKFVAPNDQTLALALNGTKLDEKTGVLSTDFTKLSPDAYPGTSIVYAVVPTIGLSKTTADNYAKFLEYAAEPGQVRGYKAGQLPDGYVPLSTPMREQTTNAAKAVREQKGEVPAPPPGLAENPAAGLPLPPGHGGATNGAATGAGNTFAGNNQAPAAGTPSPSASPTGVPTVDKAATSVATRTDSSGFAKWVLPGLLAIAVLAGLIAFGAMVWTQPGHPVRRVLRAAVDRLRRS
ncbi:hypothetical protein ALI144C_30305 [Actinosynnema sp. ALI-1.44]|uniref:hypothetical protein n=1 Tax=Actinosynnema sp. ALI-1.44 TaxID=1933779 RepID=UPI00097CAF46|nr:hypothetical protein [Actinosynnema sp. ALI-1.44]ONI77743.1 hypothetical protein ALI144C_30305 [Actinosynnema sp. ALI-1.44]